MRKIVNAFKALSDPNRIRILKMLEFKPLCVCEITAILNLAVSTVSKHLSILRQAGFLIDEKQGKWVEYRLNNSTSGSNVDQMLALMKQWLAKDSIICLDAEKVKTVDRNLICGD